MSQFGNIKGSKSDLEKTKALVMTMGVVVVVLLGVVIYLATRGQVQPPQPPAEAKAPGPTILADEEESKTKRILVAKRRIASGDRISSDLLTDITEISTDVSPNVVLLANKGDILGKYAKVDINPNVPIVYEHISNQPPLSLLDIPPGYRAIAITVDARTGVGGWAKPGVKVDVHWTFKDEGRMKLKTVVRQAEVLSVGGVRGGAQDVNKPNVPIRGQTTVTLLVTLQDSQKIELARTQGNLTLALVGAADPTLIQDEEPIDINILMGDKKEDEEESCVGTMISPDPDTGELVKWCLQEDGKWVVEGGL